MATKTQIKFSSQPIVMDKSDAMSIIRALHPKRSVNCAVKMRAVGDGYIVEALRGNTIFHTKTYASIVFHGEVK